MSGVMEEERFLVVLEMTVSHGKDRIRDAVFGEMTTEERISPDWREAYSDAKAGRGNIVRKQADVWFCSSDRLLIVAGPFAAMIYPRPPFESLFLCVHWPGWHTRLTRAGVLVFFTFLPTGFPSLGRRHRESPWR